jgi:hypothetical protein
MDKKQEKVLSFVSGLVVFSVITAVVLYKDDRLRRDLARQARGYLDVSGEVLRHLQFLVTSIGKRVGVPKTVKESSNYEVSATASSGNSYDELWDRVQRPVDK